MRVYLVGYIDTGLEVPLSDISLRDLAEIELALEQGTMPNIGANTEVTVEDYLEQVKVLLTAHRLGLPVNP